MSTQLQRLAKGDKTSTLKTCLVGDVPVELDLHKFQRGQSFFQRNIAACLFTMMCSLVVGLSLNNLLDPLVFTNRSDTPKKSLIRYLKTMVHIMQWHYGNVWDLKSKARQSIQKVCSYHDNTRDKMNTEKGDKFYVSQYDMSLVQAGFVGAIIMYPAQFGISAKKAELEDFVYFWRWIGYLLGIDKNNNICQNSLEEALTICHDIENLIVYPALKSPPAQFKKMSKAFTDGTNMLRGIGFITPESIICFSLDRAGKKRLKHSFVDKFRIIFLKLFVNLLYYSSTFRSFMNHMFEKLCYAVENNKIFLKEKQV